MAIVKVNDYEQGIQDISNLAENVDNLRLGVDLTWVEKISTTYYVKQGSIIELNGDTYVVQDSDEIITGSALKYIYFNGSSFSFSATVPVLDSTKLGYYNGSNRAIRWVQDAGSVFIDEKNDIYIVGDLFVDGDINATGIESVGRPTTKNVAIPASSTSITADVDVGFLEFQGVTITNIDSTPSGTATLAVLVSDPDDYEKEIHVHTFSGTGNVSFSDMVFFNVHGGVNNVQLRLTFSSSTPDAWNLRIIYAKV